MNSFDVSVVTRRRFLGSLAALAGAACLSRAAELGDASRKFEATPILNPRYKIGVCDWMVLKRQKLGAFPLAKEIGADGVEVDMGGLGQRETFDNTLVDATVRKQFLDKARELKLDICSVAMSGFYAQKFAERTGIERMVQDCIDTMKNLGVYVAFLPLGVQSDLMKHPELRPAVLERLKAIAPLAEKAGVVIGVETAYDAANEVKLLDEVGSKAIQSYFNFSNAVQNGRDISAELRTLGRDRICQIHCTDQDGVQLREDKKLDLKQIKATLDDLGWKGWLVMERSREASRAKDVKWNFGNNAKYLKEIFQS